MIGVVPMDESVAPFDKSEGGETYDAGVPDNTDGDWPTFARLSTSLFRCFLMAFTSSARAADLYASFISARARARASASGLRFLLVSGI
jgi:hypothetical protein